MKFKEKFLEITGTNSIPSTPIPMDIVDAWKKTIDYDFRLKRKYSYYDVVFKTKNITSGFKGHVTRSQNKLKQVIDDNKLDHNETVKRLYRLHPPKHF